jgi:hypothetical protein
MIHPRTGQEVNKSLHKNCNAYCNVAERQHADIARSDISYTLDEIKQAMLMIEESIEVLDVREAPEADPYIRGMFDIGPFKFRYLVIWRIL